MKITIAGLLVLLSGVLSAGEPLRAPRAAAYHRQARSGQEALDMPLGQWSFDGVRVQLAAAYLASSCNVRVAIEQMPCRGVTIEQLKRPVTVSGGAATVREVLDRLVAANPVYRWWQDAYGAIHVTPKGAEEDPAYPMLQPWTGGCRFEAQDLRAIANEVYKRLQGDGKGLSWYARVEGYESRLNDVALFTFARPEATNRSVLDLVTGKMDLSYDVCQDDANSGRLHVNYAAGLTGSWDSMSATRRPDPAFRFERSEWSPFDLPIDALPPYPMQVREAPAWAAVLAVHRRCGQTIGLELTPTAHTTRAELDRLLTFDVPRGVECVLTELDLISFRQPALERVNGRHTVPVFGPRDADAKYTPDYPMLKTVRGFAIHSATVGEVVAKLAAALSADGQMRFVSRVTDEWVDRDGDPYLITLSPADWAARDLLCELTFRTHCSWLVAPLDAADTYGIWLAPRLPLADEWANRITFKPEW